MSGTYFAHYDMKRSLFFLILFTVCGTTSVLKSAGILSHQISELEWSVGGDKHLHFLIASTLGFVSVWMTPKNNRKIFGLCGFVTLFLYLAVITDEFSQYYLPRREFSFLDMAMDVSGVSFGVIVYALLSWFRA